MTQDMHVYGFMKRAISNNGITSRRQRDYVSSSTRSRLVITLLLMLVLGATGVWADDLSGLYYIASRDYNEAKTTTNFYLCPTEGWYYYQSTSPYYTNSDNGMPFMTTYQCRNGAYTARNALWSIEKVDKTNYYYIKHVSDGKYLTYNVEMGDGSNVGRMRIHLEASPSDDEAAQFQINWVSAKSCYEITTKKWGPDKNRKYLNPTGPSGKTGNINSLVGTNARADGPSGCPNVGGIIGLWTAGPTGDVNSSWYLEDASVAAPTFSMNGAGDVTITAESGTTIHYTLDGTTPTEESTTYSAAITAGTIPARKTVRAIAVRTSDGVSSAVATLPLVTYHIVNKSNNTAVSSMPRRQVAGTSISGYASIPTEIKSPYISNEEITFYSWEGAFNASNLDTEHRKDTIPAQSADAEGVNIYVTYSTAKLGEKFLHLQMARPMNIKHEESSTYKYIYDNNGTLTYDASADASKTDSKYLWYIGNNAAPDPYNVLVKNSTKSSNLKYASSTLSLAADATPYVITDTTFVDATHQDITLKNFSTGDSFTISVNEVKIPTSYHLIDKAGHIIFGPKESTSSTMEIPSEWKSPVVPEENGYHYWKIDAFDVNGSTYTLKENQTELGGLAELSPNEHIYITYDLDVDNLPLDLDGRNSLNIANKVNLTYRLQFAHGVNFNQEDGKDGVMTATRKPVYPYSNGDAALYVYGDERWEEQLASGASTRTRWLWFIEPANSPANQAQLDPYHVKISSYQTQTSYKIDDDNTRNFHSYLKTYKPDGHNAIVTGVTNDNPAVTGKAEDAEADNSDATEYMILGTSMNNLKLVTFDAISDGSTSERRTVNSFEQYWKNNPTVQKKLTTKVTAVGRNVTLNSDQKTEIYNFDIEKRWHVYKTWANSQPWVHNNDNPGGTPTTGKNFLEEEHVFQTVDMGDGEFQFIETEIKPMLVLLDQHGWEIVRLPLPSGPDDPKRAARYAELHKYSSPMVEKYHFWKTGTKIPGYHKFTVSDYATELDGVTEYTADELGRADLNNSTPNLPNYETQALVSGKERDWYVTYDVKAEYANAYSGAASEGAISVSPYLIKQNGSYAQYSGSGNTISTTPIEPNMMTVPASMQWYIKPNFNIDAEMGYHYEGQYEEKSKEETDQDNFDGGKNGFDPYNVQIKSAVPNTDRYFTANTSGSAVTSMWAGKSNAITLENMTETTRQPGVIGLDQTEMKITNATFMVVDDGNGNMRLMPRFDNTKVMHSFTTLANPATANADSIAKQAFTLTQVPQVVNSSDDIKVMGGKYLLSNSFAASGSIGTKKAPFKGTIEGQIDQSFSVSAPFIAYADGATIKNVIIENADITSGDTIGAIVATANGATRIYNCGVNGGGVKGNTYVGGIVGLLNDSSRVINCYSYADVDGGTGGGIVGYNSHASTATATNLKTMVMNCMFYGNMTCSNKAPIYNGENISNVGQVGLGNYNYFLANKPYVDDIDNYNCALTADSLYLQRFEFYRLLLNSHLELAGWYATGKYDKDEMMKWVLETADRTNANPKPYPVLKKRLNNDGTATYYPSIINYDAANAPTSEERNIGKNLGTLPVKIQMGTNSPYSAPTGASITDDDLSLPITDKDFERYNFNYRKVQLPYYNDVGTGNYTKASDGTSRVVTGWKITAIFGGTAGSFTTGDDAPAYNFADRNCTNKDLYSKSGRVFNQGAYWDVPEGVTGITIEPYWAKAAYLADAYPDVVYNSTMTDAYNNGIVGGGQIYKNGLKYDIAGEEQVVYTSTDKARDALGLASGQTVYDNAIVLVGNVHRIGITSDNKDHYYTIMSADFDHDNEPDYSYILRFNDRNKSHPVRVDFLNMPGLGMAQKSTGGTGSYNFGIIQPLGWFESTNTSLFRVTQFEYDHQNRVAAPLILQGGVIEQWVSGQNNGVSNNTTYFHVGGNVWFKEFHRGTHQDKQLQSKHPPLSVTGGDYNEFYLTGLYKAVTTYNDNAECYISGGRFGIVAGTGLEGLGNATNHTNGNIVWQIQHADIEEFYGGGINAASPIQGNITTVITDSYVKQFCGGPKFGDMNSGKTVTTTATDCTFGTYFGAGYGGNSYSRQAPFNYTNVENVSWNRWIKGEIRNKADNNFNGYQQDYKKLNYDGGIFEGVSTQFNYQFLPMSNNANNVGRLFIDYVKFSLATTRKVTSALNNCTVTGNFYGGGSLGKVDGDVTSTLTNCSVKGNVFGAGFSASLPTVEVDAIGFETEPYYYKETGTYRQGVKGATTTYTWQHRNETINSTELAIDKTNHILYTNEDLTTLGAVTGTVTLNIEGNTLVEGYVFDSSDNPTTQSGGVFGGGDASSALGNTIVNINTTSQQSGSSYNAYNVFGGGNVANVGGTTTVNVNNGIVSQRVFGGGNEADVNTDANVVMTGGTVLQGVYGGCNTQGAIVGNATVNLTGGTVGSNWGETAPDPLPNVVFGGGLGEPTLVNGNVTVNVGTKSDDPTPVHAGTAMIYGNVYGGSALGHTNASKTGSDPMVFNADKTTNVNLYAGTVNGYVFGGGLGRKYKAAVAQQGTEGQPGYVPAQSEVTAVESYVGGDVNVLLDGAKVHQIFGCNNLNGTPKGHVKVHVKQTNNFSGDNAYKNNSTTALDSRTTYDVDAVYGGGNQADYVPTDATIVLNPASDTYKADSIKVAAAKAEVLIEGCDKTSIEYVYGGGNAAAVPADSITVNSAYIIGYLFGGGNGSGADNPGANVGIIDTTAYKANPANGIYGTGTAKTKLIGGQIRYVYGGSNTKGNVRGGTSLERKNTDTNKCDLKIGEIYGAGQLAPMDGDVIIKLDCMPEDFVSQVFGGAKNATINGNVSLTVSSGRFGRVFGGNNQGGSINGSIEVNAYEDGCKPLIIGELYGGGFNAPYSIWGCNDDDKDGTWTPNTSGTTPYVKQDTIAVSVNVYSCTSIGKVFGGGFGAKANVVGNTHVWINTMQGLVDGKEQTYETVPENVYIGKIGQVFGGGNAAPVKGDVTIDIGTATASEGEKIGVRIISGNYLKTTVAADTTITAGIYGGGNAADVDGNVTMNIGTVSQNQGITIGGDVYGGGYGETTHVTGNVTMNIGADTGTAPAHNYVGYANITGDVYGGSAKGKVNSHLNNSSEETVSEGKTTHVNFYGGTLAGNLYGGGKGEATHAADVFGPVTVTMGSGSVNNVFGCNNVLGTPKDSVVVNINGGTIKKSVYGGGNQAAYTPISSSINYPAVRINNGTVTENVFGGGLGLTATVTANPHVTIGNNVEGDTVRIKESVYGGGQLAGVTGSTYIVVNSDTIGTKDMGGATYGNIYGGGFGNTENATAGLVSGNTNITVNGGTVLHNIYGGGAYGSVGSYTYAAGTTTCAEGTGTANITITGGTVGSNGHENGMVFGASRGDVAAPDGVHDRLAWVNNTNVIIGTSGEGHGADAPEPQIKGSVYGGGENGHTFQNASVTIHSGRIGITDVSIDGGAAYLYRGNVYGGGCGTDKYVDTGDGNKEKYNQIAGIVQGNAVVTIDGGHVVRNVYGAGAMGSVTGKTTVNISGKSVIGADGSGGGYVYAAARGSEDMADGYATVGSTMLNISGGTIWQSAFGGGQLGTVKGNVAVTVSGGVVKNDVYGGGALANTNTDNWNTSGSAFEYVEVTPAPTVGTTPVGGYYTRTGSDPNYIYTLVPNGSAAGETTYYKKKVVGDWKASHPHTTTVVLTGGVIGNAYGGGLGSSTVAANVYGDVKVTVNKPEEMSSTGGSGVAFTRNTVNVTYGTGDKQKEYVVPVTGRVFGCNNINGTPTGNVRVEVYATRQIEFDERGNHTLYPISGEGSEHSPNEHNKYYEVQAVYGGGNLSDYLPATGKATTVYIGECDVTSIEKVYGGGNSAVVPSSEVVINGSYDIGTAFGGGNGGDLVQKDGVWHENDGAIVIGTALMKPKGGKVGEVFGGSDAKGFCGNPVIDKTETNPYCKLVTTRMYGAGKESDVDKVDIIISGCTAENTDIEYVFGGSYNAHITHDINLTIKAGVFKNVFGGNDRTGSIGGNITVNIEETEDCVKPLIIQNLFGGGNQAAYPGTKRDGTEITTSGKITVNVKSATRIDNIFGGSFMADVNGDTEVNINMTKGFWAGKTYQGKLIPDSVGVIGNIYGGGNQGVVRGDSKVNICTTDSVGYKTIPAHLPGYKEKNGLYYVPVTGARITGNVFGGGNEANVNGNDTVRICTADYSKISGFQGVSISKGSVFGGGSAADVKGNTYVKMSGGYVFNGIFGGGLSGSVGTFERKTGEAYTNVYGHTPHTGCIGKPISCAEGTGKCTVIVDGGQIGPVDVAKNGMNRSVAKGGPIPQGWVWGGGCGLIEDPSTNPDTHFKTYVGSTDVTIGGTAFILESVIGGGEFGRVLGNTLVKIKDHCQIGVGDGQWETVDGVEKPIRYTDGYDYGSGATTNQFIDPTETQVTDVNALAECSHFPYGRTVGGKKVYLSYDPYYDKYYAKNPSIATSDIGPASTAQPSDGKTWIGCVFGGGSGYMPYEKDNGTGYDWCRSAGWVEGNTNVQISGGHILTNVYGANEYTDVKGQAIVTMTGGTIGVPRTLDSIAAHPVTCYLFGGGKGDERPHFSKHTNTGSVKINVSGGIIYGSVFGGAEDGHVLGNDTVNISADAKIGTFGTSYVDGNVFGGGRGFSGKDLLAGSVGGNVTMTISGGKMLGSIYGGGRLASVGIDLDHEPGNDSYGQLKDETGENDAPTYGHITINITGGTIGNASSGTARTYGGNVFGGSMGRITLLDGTLNPVWPKMAVAKLTNVTISGGEIKNNVYGGSEYGVVRNRATVNVEGGTIDGHVYGGGFGSDERDTTTITAGGYSAIPTSHYTFTPMTWTGCVSGETYVNISGGQVKKNVYGGGEFASVGLINFNSNEDGTVYNYITKHESLTNGFGLSWPYEFQYITGAPNDAESAGGKKKGGKATVTVTGGRIGTTGNTGFVFGGSKGQVEFGLATAHESSHSADEASCIIDEQRYVEAFCANVRETKVNINYASTPASDNGSTTECIVGAVYGGGQDGHVEENAVVSITGGLIGQSVYGGGQGESTYKGYLRDQSSKKWKTETEDLCSWTAGKVYGNTSVSMTGGLVVGHVYGGGNLASVGKGNYAGGADDYYPAGYGETLTGNLWDNVSANSKAFLSSGHVTVSITGGEVGTLKGTSGSVYGTTDATPTGMVFGGSRGRAAEDIMLDPRHEYAPDFYLGYVNTAKVTIGNADGGPRIFSQVFGGGRDGHVRDSSYVIINNGTIGQTYGETTDDYQRYHRGNVYGSGSGLGQWTTGKHGMSSGSVTNKTRVDINGGTIYNNVYGGGALSSVGPPRLDLTKDYAADTISQCVVNINGGTIGQTTPYETHKYGGCVYGASRGNDFADGESPDNFATVLWTKVNINGGDIAGNVYGGAKGGLVWKDTEVHLKGGTIAHNAYGGGQGTQGTSTIAANIGGNTTVKLNEGKGANDSGCMVEKVFGCNDLKGTPKGHALVHVYATQHKGKTKIVPDGGKYAKFESLDGGYTTSSYSGLTTLATATGTDVSAYTTVLSGGGDEATKKAALDNMVEAIADDKYDVLAVYGGGDLAPYEPTNPNETTDVIIDGCDLTSIKQVYGGGNAASTPANQVRINEAYEIHEAFGGGNGKDDYEIDGKYYKNLGANIGYKATFHSDTSGDPNTGTKVNPYPAVANADADTPEERRANTSYHYGTGTAHLIITGGRVHMTYGGSNTKGNVRAEAVTSTEDAGDCTMLIDVSTAAGKNADTDGGARLDSRCVDYQAAIYGGSTNSNVYNDVVINITNGTYGKIFGGNNLSGKIYGSITINVREEGCKPIVIDSLFAGGNKADYSIYGFNDDGSARTKAQYDVLSSEEQAKVLQRNPQINIISATRIGTIYGGAYKAKVIGSPSVNVNMEEGFVAAKYATAAKYNVGYHELSEHDMDCSYHVLSKDAEGKAILKIGTIGTIFGGGSLGDIYGDTRVDIGTGKHFNFAGEEEVITPARNAAFILGKVVAGKYVGGQVYGGGDQGYVFGNSTVNIANGYIYDRVYGGGKEGTVGEVSTRAALPAEHTSHPGCLGGKPSAFATGTGRTAVTVSGGYVGPFIYERSASTRVATPKPMTMPEDYGYVFGAGRGELTNPATDKDIDFRTYVDSTVVTISDSALIAGGVYGGSENGRVLRNTHVNIRGGQIGIGKDLTAAYAESAFIDPTTTTVIDENMLAECAAWPYGIDTNEDGKKDKWLPYDEHAGDTEYDTENYGPASTTGSDGHTFYGNVFGGGSGYFTYPLGDGKYEWLPSAGLVEGDTYVNISGGHILTNVYGGNEMTNVTGTTHVTMTGGTLGVPRTLARIAEHPVTCYLFGGGKGDQRVHFNKSTNVGHANVTVSGGIIYGSVFGGGEDGHVLGDVTMNISDGAKIGTWGTSYVEGNVFGGGRGFGGDAYTAGNVAGSVTMNISGGTMLGSVYGGGRLGSVGYGLYAATEIETDGHKMYGEMQDDDYGDWYLDGTTYKRDAKEGFKRGHIEVNISGDNTVIGNKYEYQNVPTDVADLDTWKTTNHVPNTAYETTSKTTGETTTYTHRLLHTRGGNVYAGGMGRREQLDGTSVITDVDWHKLGNVKSTKLTITGGTIKSNVYGGCEYGAVQGTHTTSEKQWGTEINITGGTIGTEIVDETAGGETKPVMYTFGSVFGGGTGTIVDVLDNVSTPVSDVNKLSAYVANNAKVAVTDAIVRASVYGGGELSAVGGNTDVTISGTTKIGRDEVKLETDADAGYVMFGGWRMGNVYGGGRGSEKSTIAGLVKGNTNVTISGGNVYHNVYGGGALASVGNFSLSTGTVPSYIPLKNVPYDWAPNTGTATVTITGGTIGISGRDNGLVFGSSRGDMKKPEADANEGGKKVDPYDRVAWVNKSVVNIGTKGSGSVYTTPLIKGSVYGGGENGHNTDSAKVNIYSGTIGIVDKLPDTETADPWWDFKNDSLNTVYRGYRGNVYGAGSGSDTYTGDDGKEYYNPKSGMVGGNTVVNIYGGHVGRNVYGGGAMAMVGTITNVNDTTAVDKGGTGTARHTSEATSFALSWPYKFVFKENTGKATVNITGGHIGTLSTDGGDVFGSSRGVAGDRYATAHLAYVKETEVNVNYPAPVSIAPATTVYEYYTSLMPTIKTNFNIPCITGSVSGSGENGYVYGDTYVTLKSGLVGHSLYGGGKGKGTYTQSLNKIGGGGTYNANIYSLIAGKVFGNTYVTMIDGYVGRNVYGGGNMASVGKGSYAGGADDYYPDGYGEKITGNLWSSAADGDDAWEFLNSGKTTVNVISGNVGYIDESNPANSMKNELPYGNVIGGSAGEAAPNLPASLTENRYLYCPAYYSGYVNETDVTIGGYRCKTAYGNFKVDTLITAEAFSSVAVGDTAKWQLVGPTIYASVYGGGQDGHVRRDTKVTVLGGEIGKPYNATNISLLKTDDLDSPQWMHRGNVYGGGSGITQYTSTLQYKDDTPDAGKIPTTGYGSASGSVTRFTEVNILGGIIHRNVYGGGSMGSVGAPDLGQGYAPYKKDLSQANKANWGKQSQNTVNIGGGKGIAIIGTPFINGWKYNKTYGGEVYGASRGMSTLDPEEFSTSVWTEVNIKNKATIMGNVYGGGDNGIVKKDSEVKVGEEKVQP